MTARNSWRLSGSATRLYRCKGKTCAGGSHSGNLGSDYCAANYSGPLCEVCVQPDHYYLESKHVCEACPTVGNGVGRIIGQFVVLVAILVFLAWAGLRFQRETALRSYRSLATFVQRVRSIGPTASLKILFSFNQIVNLIPKVGPHARRPG